MRAGTDSTPHHAETRRFPVPGRLVFLGVVLLLAGAASASDAWAGPLPGSKNRPVAARKAAVPKSKQSADALRWVAATPEQMLKLAAQRADRGGAEGLAGLAIASALFPRVPLGVANAALASIRAPADIRIADEARWVTAVRSPVPSQRTPAGLVRDWALVGPFEDTGGGLQRQEGPEDGSVADLSRSWDRGAYQVRWRQVPRGLVNAGGVPLELLIAPRQESCTYLASRLTLQQPASFVLHVAGSGALRVMLDGRELGMSEEAHRGLGFDRLASKVEAAAGEHLLVVKVCAGAMRDEGRVRVRVSDGAGQGRDLPWSAALGAAGSGVADSKLEPVRTPLQDAVAVGEAPGERAALLAALVLSLGGADDERTPRASGLFEHATRGAVGPDVLAVAGWGTPFGADRSGRLNLARERAAQQGDSETEAFAQRRLAALRLEGGFPDWAMAATQAAPLAGATDTEARLLRAVVAASMRTLRAPSHHQLQQLAREASDTPSVWENLAELAPSFDRELAAAARQKLRELEPETDCGAYARAMACRGADGVRAAASRCRSEGLTDADELVSVGQVLVEVGALDDAREWYRGAVQLAPNVGELWQGLSVTAFASGKPEHTTLAQAAHDRARALQPGDARLAAEARLRSGAPELDERTLVEASVLQGIKARVPVRQGEEADRELYWKRAVEYLPDHRVKQVVHYAREVVIAPRTQAELVESVPAVEGDSIEILRARVHRAGGGLAFAEEQQSDGGRPRVRWSRLDKGDVVEVAFRTYTAGPVGRRGDPPFYFMDYAGSVETHPLLYNEVVVVTPVGQPLAVDVVNGEADERTDQERDGKRTIRMVWTKPRVVPDEPLAPHLGEVLPTVVGSTFGSWKEFLDWYRAAVQGFTEPDDQVRRLAAELTRGAATRDEKLRRVFNYVADTIRYVNYVSGEFWLPNRPQQVIARKQGDCDDKAILLIALLKAVGIEAEEVLVQTRMTAQPSVLRSKHAAIPLFDHGIAFVPAANGAPAMWLDATSPQSRLGPLPSMDARAMALFVKQGPAEIVQMPSSSPQEHGVDSDWRIVLDTAGGGELVAEERHSGDHGFMLRTNLLEPDARAQWVESNLLAGWFSGMRLQGTPGFEGDAGKGAARVSYRARSDGMARREEQEWVVPLAPNTTMTSQLAPLVARKLPVVLPSYVAPSHQSRTIRLTAPPGYTFGPLPPGGEEQGGEFGAARLQVVRDPRQPATLVVTRSISIDLSTIPVERYDAWRTWLQRVDTLMHRGVRLVPKAEAKRAPTGPLNARR